MRLEKFRVQNYKKIRDTGWVTCRDLTAFVGKNEAGKSAIFRGLSKLNPSDGEKYDGLKEFPRRRYTDEYAKQDWPVATALFMLAEEEREALKKICPELAAASHVSCTRSYSSMLTVGFQPGPESSAVTRREFSDALTLLVADVRSLVAPDGKGDALGGMKTALAGALEPMRAAQAAQVAQQGQQTVPRNEIEQVLNAVGAQANEVWQKELLEPARKKMAELAERATLEQRLGEARKWVEVHLPRFVYFDRYDVIDSAVHLTTFVQQLSATPTAPKVRTTRCLFEHVGLDIKKLASLGQHQAGQPANDQVRRLVDERAIHFSSASNAMTGKFQDWWEQRCHTFRYQADGDYFRVWVSDDCDPSEIELDQRSQGMQYFFSFFIVFLVEAKSGHQNSILLLDEPGLHMHGTAQAKIVKFLEKLARENQTLYTTHSPFMVDFDHLEQARIVYEGDDGTTKVSEDVWPPDRDSLFPLQAGLGYQLAQSLFISKRQLVVEGLIDFWLFRILADVLSIRGLPTLRDDVVVVPSAGVSKLLPLASMLIGHGVEVAALLDGDEPARREGKKLVDRLLEGEPAKCVFIGDFVQVPGAEVEDIFPESDYLSAVSEAYKTEPLSLGPAEAAIDGVANKVAALFSRLKMGRFEKWRPAAVLRDRFAAAPDRVPDNVCRVASALFQAVNAAFSPPAP